MYSLKYIEFLVLAALLHDIGKFRMRHTQPRKRHQEHSYEFVNSDFFSPCGAAFKDAIRHHHPGRYPKCRPTELKSLIERQVILADRLSAKEREGEAREREAPGQSALVSPLSRLKYDNKEYRYPLTVLNLERSTIIPAESVEVNQDEYTALWYAFSKDFDKITENSTYSPDIYQTIVALLRKYTSRIPSATPWEFSDEERSVPDISLYDHLRTTAAIAACIGREFSEEKEIEVDIQLNKKAPEKKIGMLIKGDISGIQNFLYQILSDGAARELRGRSFYLQLLTESIAHWILRQFDLPITNLLLASGGHFYILVPYSDAKEKLKEIRQTVSQKLWELHTGDLACMLAGVPITVSDFESEKFSDKWDDVGSVVMPEKKQEKWSELGAHNMFENFFEPHVEKPFDFGFDKLGTDLRDAKYLVAFEVPQTPMQANPDWRAALRTFGLDIHLMKYEDKPTNSHGAKRASVYCLGNTNFLQDEVLNTFQWGDLPVSYDFKMLPQVIPKKPDGSVADYDDLANASEGVKWLGALRMDVDELGKVFTKKLQYPTISRHASLSREIQLFFEGYVPKLCREYNKKHDEEILELIYAGGDDLFLVGGWSALPEIAEQIRSEFRCFVTGNHVTLSGGIAIEHKKFPLYQYAERSGEAEKSAKACDTKNAITFLQKPMSWDDFNYVNKWHSKFYEVLKGDKPLPHDILTRLSQIYSDKALREGHWAWRSIYYFSRLQERNKAQTPFIDELRQELNHKTFSRLREFIRVTTRWTALRIRKKGD